ncbi:MAG: polC [Candidatus Saccharibacteria bacterium]|nr:polC [Candidatus Saccharibacteria bacterium]
MSEFGAKIFGAPLVFVDIETNGLNHVRGRVIEVAAIRVENGKIVGSVNTLLDPETELPYYITSLTGITTDQVRKAPTFDQVADELKELLDGAVFVAHNVRFDYSFLKQEFGRLGMDFLPKQLCTVRLSRALYPHERSHKLESLIQRHGFTFAQRHRAYDDAAVLWQFLQYIAKHFPPEQIDAAVAKQLKQPAIPKQLQPELVRDLPNTPGVYIFEDSEGRPLYVGKSINIKQRVLSHFGRDHAEVKEFKISQNISHITTHQTPGELSALLLESRLVKELQPLYNRQLRRTSKLILAEQQLDKEGYLQVQLTETAAIEPESATQVLAVYPRRSKAKQNLLELQKTYDLCPKLLGLEKASGSCFLYQLKKCRGACIGQESAPSYNRRLHEAFDHQRIQAWPYSGAVLVEEKTPDTTSRGIVIDQWCVIGELTQEPYCEPLLTSQDKSFDLDTYKILQSFLANKLNTLRIQAVSLEQLGV